MVILYLYDPTNGYRYRKFGYAYYTRVSMHPMIVSAWILPDSVDSENAR